MFDLYNNSRSASTKAIVIKINPQLIKPFKLLTSKINKGLMYDYIPIFGFNLTLFISSDNKIYIAALKKNIIFRQLEIFFPIEKIRNAIDNGKSPLFDILNSENIDVSHVENSKNQNLYQFFVHELILLTNIGEENE